jgi:hypothetical protein
MRQMNDLDPKFQQFAELAVAEIAVPPLRRGMATSAGSRQRPRLAIFLAGLAISLLLGCGVAAATGLFSEVFRSGNVSSVGSRAVTLEGARVAQLPLPQSDQLAGGWKLNQVQLTMTETWRSVDLQYRRPGSRGMGIGVWSEGITVNPTADHIELVKVSGVQVEIASSGSQRTARFMQEGATVIIRGFADELGSEELATLVAAWLAQAR